MNHRESFSNPRCVEQIRLAECELSAFVAAITKLCGPGEARLAAKVWLNELELMDSPVRPAGRDYRTVTIAAAARLASRLKDAAQPRASFGSSTDDTKVSLTCCTTIADFPILGSPETKKHLRVGFSSSSRLAPIAR